MSVTSVDLRLMLAEFDSAAYSWMLALLGVVLLAAAIVFWVLKRWQQQSREETDRPSDQMSQFREMFEQGELSSEEFARIRGKLTGKLLQKLDQKSAPEPPPASPSEPDSTTPK